MRNMLDPLDFDSFPLPTFPLTPQYKALLTRLNSMDIARIKRVFGTYAIEKTEDSACVLLSFHKDAQLHGELHADAPTLIGIEALINALKTLQFIDNTDTPIINNKIKDYNKQLILIAKMGMPYQTTHALKVEMHQNGLKLNFAPKDTTSPADTDKLISDLKSVFERMPIQEDPELVNLQKLEDKFEEPPCTKEIKPKL